MKVKLFYVTFIEAFIWNWYEVKEGIFVSLIFVVVPLILHAEKRHRDRERESERRHQEVMVSHKNIHDHLGIK